MFNEQRLKRPDYDYQPYLEVQIHKKWILRLLFNKSKQVSTWKISCVRVYKTEH
jgi:hypothetical protein